MSGFQGTTNGSKRMERALAVIFVVVLVIFATIIVLESSSLRWPLATDINNFFSPFRGSNNANSSLLISATSSVPSSLCVIANNRTQPCTVVTFNPVLVQPINNASIVISTNGLNPKIVATNRTDAVGQSFFIFPPGTYKVDFTSDVVNLTTFVTAAPGNTTELDIGVNETSYPCSFIDISNPLPNNLIVPWNTIFLTVQSDSIITQNTNESVYLQFLQYSQYSEQGAIIISPTFLQKVNIRILSGYYSNTSKTQWLEVQLDSIVNITDTTNINLLAYLTSYAISEYPMNSSITTNQNTIGSFITK